MSQPTIDDMNIEIARFDGRLFYGKYPIDAYGGDTGNALPEMQYHSSWNWIMPVWMKFRDIGIDNIKNEEYQKWLDALRWYLFSAKVPKDLFERLYYAIVWHNKQKL